MFYQKGWVFFFRSGLLDLIHTWNKDVGQFYEDRINEQKKAYSERQDTFAFTIHYENLTCCVHFFNLLSIDSFQLEQGDALHYRSP